MVYYGVIYFKDGMKVETGSFSGPGAESSCERHVAMQFEQYKQTADRANDTYHVPTRYEVKSREEY